MANGSFGGGFAEGLAQGQESQRRVGNSFLIGATIRQRRDALDAKTKAALVESATKNLKTIYDELKTSLDEGGDPANVSGFLDSETTRALLDQEAAKLGVSDGKTIAEQIKARLSLIPSPAMRGAAAGEEAAASTMAQIPADAAKTTAVGRAENRLAPTATAFFNPQTRQIRSVNESDPADVNAARAGGFVKAPTSVQATSLDDIGLQKGTLKNIETMLTNNGARLQRLDLVGQSFDPEFLTFESKLRSAGLSFQEKLGGDLTPSQQQFLTDFTTARRDAAAELNASLRAASGAAVTPQESQRFLLETPDFQNDSPTQFLAKLARGKEALRLAQIRLQIIRNRGGAGLSGEAVGAEVAKIPLSGVRTIIKQQAHRIEAEIRQAQPGISEGELKSQVKSRLAERFGMLR